MSTERQETERQKRIRRTQEATVYRVQQDLGGNAYRIAKRVIDAETEVYHVTVKGDEVWCDCPGFRRQKFDLHKHKHVRAAQDFIRRGCPEYADYRFIGSGRNTKVRFIKAGESNGKT